MKVFSTYAAAILYASELATTHQLDAGIEKAREFSATVYRVSLLPKPENRFGWELTCEVVQPHTPIGTDSAIRCRSCGQPSEDNSGLCRKCE